MIDIKQFKAIEMRVGTVIDATLNEKAVKPAYVLKIDFGAEGLKTSSAQLTKNYDAQDLIGKQVIAVMNFPTLRVAGIKSEVLVLAGVSEENNIILLTTEREIKNGTLIS